MHASPHGGQSKNRSDVHRNGFCVCGSNGGNDPQVVGSPGNETNLFGNLTLKAIQKFQVKYGIANPGEEGYGQVGPKTRAKLNELGR